MLCQPEPPQGISLIPAEFLWRPPPLENFRASVAHPQDHDARHPFSHPRRCRPSPHHRPKPTPKVSLAPIVRRGGTSFCVSQAQRCWGPILIGRPKFGSRTRDYDPSCLLRRHPPLLTPLPSLHIRHSFILTESSIEGDSCCEIGRWAKKYEMARGLFSTIESYYI